jgi:hypothetical protein
MGLCFWSFWSCFLGPLFLVILVVCLRSICSLFFMISFSCHVALLFWTFVSSRSAILFLGPSFPVNLLVFFGTFVSGHSVSLFLTFLFRSFSLFFWNLCFWTFCHFFRLLCWVILQFFSVPAYLTCVADFSRPLYFSRLGKVL